MGRSASLRRPTTQALGIKRKVMDEMKECKTCGEEIKAKALKCPRCQTWQTKWKYDQSNPKHHLIFIAILFGAMGIMFYSSLGSIFNTNEFSDNKSLVVVKDSKVSFTEKECGTTVSIIGTITNNSEESWKDFNFEAQFFNENNELIDTVSDQNYDLILLPNDDGTFKVTGAADKSEASYNHHKVIIKDARENSSLF